MNTNHMTGEELVIAYCAAVFCANFTRQSLEILRGPAEELYLAGCANMGKAEFDIQTNRAAVRYFGTK